MQHTVRLNGITVGTPIIVRVEAADVSIPHCVVDEDGRDETTAGVPTVAVLQAMDEYGNKLASEAGKFNATLIGGVNVTGVVSYASGGQYDIAYTALVREKCLMWYLWCLWWFLWCFMRCFLWFCLISYQKVSF